MDQNNFGNLKMNLLWVVWVFILSLCSTSWVSICGDYGDVHILELGLGF